jgi:hypothetical protein
VLDVVCKTGRAIRSDDSTFQNAINDEPLDGVRKEEKPTNSVVWVRLHNVGKARRCNHNAEPAVTKHAHDFAGDLAGGREMLKHVDEENEIHAIRRNRKPRAVCRYYSDG